MLNYTFYVGRKQRRRIFSFLAKLEGGLQEHNSRKIRVRLQK